MKDGHPFVIDGHCRRRASLIAIDQGAELQSVPCKMVDRSDNDADKVAYLFSTNSNRPLTPMEKAAGCRRLHDMGLNNKTIAFKTGLSISRVGQLLDLLSAPQKVLDMINRGEVSASLAVSELKVDLDKASDILQGALDTARKEGKQRATKKHFDPMNNDFDGDPIVAAFEAMDSSEIIQKNWISFKGGWDAAMRHKRGRKC